MSDEAAVPTLVVSEVFGPTFQGEGPTLGRRAAFVRLGRCNLDCSWCFVPETPILMADWTWRPAGELQVGDRVIGRTMPEHGAHGRLVATTVTALARRHAPLVLVDRAVRCTPDHPFWIAGGRHHGSGWRAVERCVGATVGFLTAPTPLDDREWSRGWLAGMADGDGCFWTLRHRGGDRRFRLARNDTGLLDRFRVLAEEHGFELRTGVHTPPGFQGRGTMPCLWLTVAGEAERFERFLAVDDPDPAWAWGYIGGMLDAEGSASGAVLRLAQSSVVHPETCKRVTAALDRVGLRHTVEDGGFCLHTSGGARFDILTRARPAKASFAASGFRAPNNNTTIEDVEHAGAGDVITITTDVGSFVAAGYIVKNCDTPYTWDWERFDPAVELSTRTVDDVVAEVEAMGVDRVVVTGGEPLLQQRRLVPFVEAAAARGWAVEVETNGTLAPSAELAAGVERFNVSPKLANSGVDPAKAVVPDALAALVATGKAAFKFVVTGVDDLDEIEGFGLDPSTVHVMPEGTTPEAVLGTARALADEVARRGWNLTTRLHVLLWGDERGR